ncbi:hypothetical protein NUW58_g6631 [Xylaria curta]|uniref:Uncharacterized protein n=1 Tax=Xylaria curta TaxID=42375 RepID=A0ACC1NQV5_9PEZI|nr:hypothetical protein NUW58_g6631 [Xylaria curta]
MDTSGAVGLRLDRLRKASHDESLETSLDGCYLNVGIALYTPVALPVLYNSWTSGRLLALTAAVKSPFTPSQLHPIASNSVSQPNTTRKPSLLQTQATNYRSQWRNQRPPTRPPSPQLPQPIPSAIASAVGTPQSLPPMDPEERAKSLNVSLADMVAKATALYQSKKYEEAAEIFSTATERQAELNGEMPLRTPTFYFSMAPGEKKPGSADKPKAKKPQAESSTTDAPSKETPAEAATDEAAATIAKDAGAQEGWVPGGGEPLLFRFTGDENFEDSDEEEAADGEGQGEEDEEDDDLAVAFEILELSRVLFEKQLEEATAAEEPNEDNAADENKIVRHTKERLSDIHDLLAEISLENEKFPEAIKDCRATLKYKKELYSEDSEIIAEAHYKLSLALEFASMTTTSEDNDESGPKTVDEAMRAEAAEELEKAIESTKLKLQNKEITDVKDIIADMEQRVSLPLPRRLLVSAIPVS